MTTNSTCRKLELQGHGTVSSLLIEQNQWLVVWRSGYHVGFDQRS